MKLILSKLLYIKFFQAPWSAAIRLWDNATGEYKHHCGGSIITRNHILTAAHCLDQRILSKISDTKSFKDDLQIILGMENPGLNCSQKESVTYQVEDFFIHPEFDFPYFDVALIELTRKVEFTKGIASICLSRASSDDLTSHAVSLSGWGATKQDGAPSNFLRSTNQLKVTPLGHCKNKIGIFTYDNPLYASVFNRKEWLKTSDDGEQLSMEGLICIEDQDSNGLTGSCEGDSGSPVVEHAYFSHDGQRYEQVGIVSGGICSDSHTPSVLTHIGHERVSEFIHNISKFTLLYLPTYLVDIVLNTMLFFYFSS